MRKYLRHYGTFLIMVTIAQPAMAIKMPATSAGSSAMPTVIILSPTDFKTQVNTNVQATQARLATAVAQILPPSSGSATAQPVAATPTSTTSTVTSQPSGQTSQQYTGFGAGSGNNSLTSPGATAPVQDKSSQLPLY